MEPRDSHDITYGRLSNYFRHAADQILNGFLKWG